MKICPTCRRTYDEESLNFCLEDGTPLRIMGEAPATVMMSSSTPTDPARPYAAGPQTGWEPKQPYSLQPKRSSRTWLWIVGLVGGALLLCGGGVVGVFFLAALGSGANQATNYGIANSGTNASMPSNRGADPRTNVETIDLSKWVRADSKDGVTEFKNGEFLMASRRKDYYYVLVAEPRYSTDAAYASVIVRNVDDADSSLGYGLIFLSDPTPLKRGYAFLIDTRNKRYRVVRHEPKKEIEVLKWTNSAAIRSGPSENKLSVDHRSGQIDLYINDQKMTSIPDTHGFPGGVAGIYAGDAARIAFKNLEIRR